MFETNQDSLSFTWSGFRDGFRKGLTWLLFRISLYDLGNIFDDLYYMKHSKFTVISPRLTYNYVRSHVAGIPVLFFIKWVICVFGTFPRKGLAWGRLTVPLEWERVSRAARWIVNFLFFFSRWTLNIQILAKWKFGDMILKSIVSYLAKI